MLSVLYINFWFEKDDDGDGFFCVMFINNVKSVFVNVWMLIIEYVLVNIIWIEFDKCYEM